ncbi:DUF5722 domain-containing protein [Haloferula chungangensis]|uniref:DUF5722 domain-containing protein n=1 Tax=Haloferula chungangensis TaxID=1048331 RepID=A0ABW2L263_9BACT
MIRLIFILLATLSALTYGQGFTLRIHSETPNDPRVKIEERGTVIISEGGPISLRFVPSSSFQPKASVLEFEVFSLGGCENITATKILHSGSSKDHALPAIDHSEAWTRYSAPLEKDPSNPAPWKSLTLHLPLAKGATLNIRNARVRPPNANDFASTHHPTVAKRNELIRHYLGSSPEARIDEVALSESEVSITFTAGSDVENLFLAELPIHRSIDEPTRFEFMQALTVEPGSSATLSFPRIRERLGRDYDRLTSRWQLVKVDDGERLAHSHARYPDRFPSAHPELPAAKPRTKKGLGGWAAHRQPQGDLEKLDIAAVTVNVIVDSLISTVPGKNTSPIQWQGRSFHANQNALANFDRTFLEAAKNDAVVSVVLLISNANKSRVSNPDRKPSPSAELIGHPDADPSGVYAMPAMDSEEGVAAYGAALHLLATRYSRPDGKYGRIHHYIVHNEVDAGWTWTNCGVKPLAYFFDLYHRSMRLVDLITRSQDPHARPFITLTHHWADPGNPKFYGSKFMLLELAKWTKVEGDFPWALAHHPYPASLRKPRTWEDKVSFDFDSDRITPKNIEVLDAWMKRPDMLDGQGRTRPIHLSENGFNSPDYTAKSLTDQAAGMAYAWKKIAALDSIEVWHYHNWIDNRHEGGLRIGLRKFPDEANDPLGEKPIFKLYRELGTEGEDAACAPYLPVVGLPDWSKVIHTGPIH